MIFIALFLCILCSCKIYFRDTFEDGEKWKERWFRPNVHEHDYYGSFQLDAGLWYGDVKKDQGLQTTQVGRHYHYISKFRREFDNDKKDLVIQYSVKFQEELIDCIGAYLKFGSKEDLEGGLLKFSENTKYSILFGPDICGTNEKIKTNLRYKGRVYEWERSVLPKYDRFQHTYTLWIKTDQTYEVLVDGKVVMRGYLDEHFDLPYVSKKIRDKTDKKPADWDDSQPKYLYEEVDVEKKDDKTGEIQNKKVRKKNPLYQGKWKPRKIPNPNFVEDSKYHRRQLSWVAFEIWSMKSGTIFDNFLVTDDIVLAKMELQKILSRKSGEKRMFDDWEKARTNRLSEERERNLERQRIRREENKGKKEEEKKRKEREDWERIQKLKEQAEKERKERERMKKKQAQDEL